MRQVSVYALLAICLTVITQTGALKCRVCNKARFLEDCSDVATCASNEECYIEERITQSATLEYIGGCRSLDVCRSASHGNIVGKRDVTLVACSRCCRNSDFCSDQLCGIQKQNSQHNSDCYSCGLSKGGPQTVSNIDECQTITTCASDEVCASEMVDVGGVIKYRLGCFPAQQCTRATDIILELIGRNCHQSGLCKRSAFNICTVCCGDNLCNTGTCQQLGKKLFILDNNHNLNRTTLRTIRP